MGRVHRGWAGELGLGWLGRYEAEEVYQGFCQASCLSDYHSLSSFFLLILTQLLASDLSEYMNQLFNGPIRWSIGPAYDPNVLDKLGQWADSYF